MAAEILNLNDTVPAAPTGTQDGKWLKGATTGNDPVTGFPVFPASVNLPMTGGAVVKTANYSVAAADCGRLITFYSASNLTVTLPATAPVVPTGATPSQWCVFLGCIGTGNLTIHPNGLNLDESASDVVLGSGCLYLTTDGTNYFTSRGAPAVRVLGLPIGAPAAGIVLSTSNVSGVLTVPFACTITAYSINLGPGDAGTVTVKVWKIAAGTAIPTSANSISTSGVSLSSGTSTGIVTTLTDFTTLAVAAGDMLVAAIFAITGTVGNVNFELKAQ